MRALLQHASLQIWPAADVFSKPTRKLQQIKLEVWYCILKLNTHLVVRLLLQSLSLKSADDKKLQLTSVAFIDLNLNLNIARELKIGFISFLRRQIYVAMEEFEQNR